MVFSSGYFNNTVCYCDVAINVLVYCVFYPNYFSISKWCVLLCLLFCIFHPMSFRQIFRTYVVYKKIIDVV